MFFPSYNYENWLWQQMKDMNFGRDVFREPQNAGSVDEVLTKYAQVIKRPNSKGAILFSVVGKKYYFLFNNEWLPYQSYYLCHLVS